MDASVRLGLTEREAAARLAKAGPNVIEDAKRRGWLRTLRSIATEPMFVLLVGAAGIYLAIGDIGEGALLAAFAGITVGLVVFQESRSERALAALRALAAPQARVVREGHVRRIAARDLVPGDVVLVAEGERVAADCVIRECVPLAADESLLTGESMPVHKVADESKADASRLFAGTLVVSGHATAEVFATGRNTRAGAIGVSLASIAESRTPLQSHLKRLVGWLGAGAIALSSVLVVWYGLARGDWLQGLLAGIAAAMGMLPEEFPMAMSVFLALGAWRLARVKVLARRPAAVEALGSATMLCVDKTGTLTENRMHLRRLVTPAADVDLARGEPVPEAVHELLEYAVLASHRDGVEPMDRAIVARGDEALDDTGRLHPEWRIVKEHPLTPDLLAVSHAWSDGDGDHYIAAKGAPEAVMDLCHVDAPQAAAITRQFESLANDGMRVLGVARARAHAPAEKQHDYEFEWLGLAAFEDPLRASVAGAVAQAHEAGIGVAMITGDHASTALSIARQAGIETKGGVLTGDELAALDDDALREAVRAVRVFARVTPQEKLRLVLAFRANGEVVAMTGDGVNDAPALKAAHIGIAMGVRGTDVARESAAIVLLDEDFSHIVGGVRMGRRIFDNLRKVMTYITAIHVPIAGVTLLPVIAGFPPMMLPAHVVLTEMIIDPICSLAFEGAPEERGIMRRPPRRSDDALVGWSMLWRGALQGVAVLAACLATYFLALRTSSVESARGQAVIALTVGNLGLVWLNASIGVGWRSVFGAGYTAFWGVAAVAGAALAAGFAVPALRELLRFEMPMPGELALALAMGAGGVLCGAALLWKADRHQQAAERR